MYFKRIEILGFKSFAQMVCIEFHEGITCIVGPNGSGKSNVSDAIRWVLGEQSPKTLRGGKMEEVIFAGTVNRKSRGIAEVTLVIDNQSGFLPIDYGEVALTRRMYRSGESEYFINGNQCRLKDMKELIMDTGMGIDGYSIIGQGKISEIISNKTQGRREIFEEAAGIIKYRAKKSEAERKLQSTNDNVERVDDIISELESRIVGLKQDSENAKEYLLLKEQYQEKEINITLKNVEMIELKIEQFKDDLLEITNELQLHKDEKLVFEEEMAQNREQNTFFESQIQSSRENLFARSNEWNHAQYMIQMNVERLSNMERDQTRLKGEMDLLEKKIQKESHILFDFQNGKKMIEHNYLQLTTLLKSKNEKYMVAEKELSDMISQIEERKNQMFEFYHQVTAGKTEIAGLESLRNSLQRREEQILKEQMDAKILQEEISLQLEHETQALCQHMDRLEKMKVNQQEEDDRFKKSKEYENALGNHLQSILNEISSIATRKNLMEAMENSYEGYSYAVKFILQNKDKLRGIIGSVADILSVPEKYAIAIETVLGGAMQNIVCMDDESAKRAVEYLKKNKAGRGTFLPMASIKPSKNHSYADLSKVDGFVGHPSKLLGYEEKYGNIIEYLLGNVVIMDHIDHAVKVSKTMSFGFRVVTLEGDIINQRGAITGGSMKSSRGNLLERKAEIIKLGNKLSDMIVKKEETVEKLKWQKEETLKAESRYQTIVKEKNQLEALIAEIRASGIKAESQLKVIINNFERWQGELTNIEMEKKSTQDVIDVVLKKVVAHEKKIMEIESNAGDGMSAYEIYKCNNEELAKEIADLKISLGTIENERKNCLENLNRSQGNMEEYEKTRTNVLAELRNLDDQRDLLEAEKKQAEEKLVQLAHEKKQLEEKMNQFILQKTECEKCFIEITKKREKCDDKILEGATHKHEIELKIARNETQCDSLKNKIWDEFEISYIQAMRFKAQSFDLHDAQKELKVIRERLKDLGEVNVGAINEYEQVKERYEFLSEQRKDLLSSMNALSLIIEDMDKTITLKFKDCFQKISDHFENIFQELYGGGTAELKLEDPEHVLESGIEIIAQPPGKKLQNINLLSGGEKSLTAIALMCAVLKVKPTPFCILDEVEAALDEVNISRFIQYLKKFKEIQFVLVTHQKATMEQADVIYGITMPEQGVSKVVSLRLGEEWDN